MGTFKQIGNISRTAMTHTAHMDMSSELYNLIVEATPEALKIEKLASRYKEALDNEGTCVNRMSKSAVTQAMLEKDAERDKLFSFINSMINSFMSYPDKTKQQAAAQLEALFNAYVNTPWKTYVEETASIDGLLRDMEGETMKTAAETLKLTEYFTTLKTLNDEYKSLRVGRTKEYNSRVKISTYSARKVVDDIWAEIAQRVNAYAVLEPTDAINEFISMVNQTFRTYKDLIAAKGGSVGKTIPEEAPVPSDDTDTTDTSDTGSDVVVGEDSDGHPTVE